MSDPDTTIPTEQMGRDEIARALRLLAKFERFEDLPNARDLLEIAAKLLEGHPKPLRRMVSGRK